MPVLPATPETKADGLQPQADLGYTALVKAFFSTVGRLNRGSMRAEHARSSGFKSPKNLIQDGFLEPGLLTIALSYHQPGAELRQKAASSVKCCKFSGYL